MQKLTVSAGILVASPARSLGGPQSKAPALTVRNLLRLRSGFACSAQDAQSRLYLELLPDRGLPLLRAMLQWP